jgi:hypothetical protein
MIKNVLLCHFGRQKLRISLKYTIANHNGEPRDIPNIYMIRNLFSDLIERQMTLNNYNEIEINLFSVSFPITIPRKRK